MLITVHLQCLNCKLFKVFCTLCFIYDVLQISFGIFAIVIASFFPSVSAMFSQDFCSVFFSKFAVFLGSLQCFQAVCSVLASLVSERKDGDGQPHECVNRNICIYLYSGGGGKENYSENIYHINVIFQCEKKRNSSNLMYCIVLYCIV